MSASPCIFSNIILLTYTLYSFHSCNDVTYVAEFSSFYIFSLSCVVISTSPCLLSVILLTYTYSFHCCNDVSLSTKIHISYVAAFSSFHICRYVYPHDECLADKHLEIVVFSLQKGQYTHLSFLCFSNENVSAIITIS